MIHSTKGIVVAATLSLAMGLVFADSTVTFDAGAEGWIGPAGPGGTTTLEPTGGNPGAHLHTVFNNFGITFFNNTNPDFIGDYTASPSVTLGVDVQVEAISFGGPVSRPWLVELRDLDNPPGGYPYVSVWFKFADISAAAHGDWTRFEITIADTSASELPAGWGGYGAENPKTFEPELPPGRTFASVLAGVDEIAFTTLEPGFAFGFTDFDLRLDNIAIGGTAADGPGQVDELRMAPGPVDGTVMLMWQPSCSGAAQDYAIYEGMLGDWYNHKRIDCSDDAGDLLEAVTPGAGNRYFLVVPLGTDDEGSYGVDSSEAERPRGTATCVAAQDLTGC